MALQQARVNEMIVVELVEINRVVRQARDFAEVNIWVRPIQLKDMAVVCWVDASWANTVGGASQAVWFCAFAERFMSVGGLCVVSPCSWESHKLRRKGMH